MFSKILQRPALAIVISLLILFLGTLSIFRLPISQFPNVAPEVVMVNITFPGASAKVLEESVLVMLDQSINGVQDMKYMMSDATSAGEATAGLCIHAKGQEYSVGGLLQDEAAARQFIGGTFLTIYLAPHNYHRVHAPLAGDVHGYRHIPGARYPVNAMSVRTVPQLFMRNERLVTYLRSEAGEIAFVMVAANGVGNITVSYEPALSTLAGGPDRGACSYEEARPLGKGDELGMFHLGSTVILLFEPGRVQIDIPTGTPVRVGQRIGRTTSLHQG